MNNLLELKNLNLSFQIDKNFRAQALYDVSFSLEKGKTLGLVGESGCGKSITAMSVMKLLPKNAVITSGEVLYNGENLIAKDEKSMQKIRGNKIVLIPQDPLTSLNPLYTVGDQISEIIEFHQNLPKREARRKVIDVMQQVNIPDAESRLDDYPHQFSGGMRQRIIIAMALCCNPELIIADEPTTALDVTVQAQILNLIKEIQFKYNTSLLLITHDLGVVAEICDYVAVMYSGRIVEYAQVKSIFKNPLHPYTKGLLASLPAITLDKLKPIPAQPPSILDNISGCIFHPRCDYCMNECKKTFPEFIEAEKGHFVSCHLYKPLNH